MLTLNRLFIVVSILVVMAIVSALYTSYAPNVMSAASQNVSGLELAISSKPIKSIRKKMSEKPSAQVAKA